MKLPKSELEKFMDSMLSYFEIEEHTDFKHLNLHEMYVSTSDQERFLNLFMDDDSEYKSKIIKNLIEYSSITNILENKTEMFREIFTQALRSAL